MQDEIVLKNKTLIYAYHFGKIQPEIVFTIILILNNLGFVTNNYKFKVLRNEKRKNKYFGFSLSKNMTNSKKQKPHISKD